MKFLKHTKTYSKKSHYWSHRIDFIDLYGAAGSIQLSPLCIKPAIWFGLNRGIHGPDIQLTQFCTGRMKLTQEQVKEIIPVLQHFVDTGELPNK
jgi:hypothetical protein